MRKEITPGLFSGDPMKETMSVMGVPDFSTVKLDSLNPLSEVKRLEKRIEGLIQEVRMKQEEQTRSIQTRFELFVQKLNSLDSKFEALAQDLRGKYSHLSSKVTEHNLSDMKTQALIDRHTHVLRQFEQRVSQLQRMIEEQEFQILNYKAALEDARKELARIKRL